MPSHESKFKELILGYIVSSRLALATGNKIAANLLKKKIIEPAEIQTLHPSFLKSRKPCVFRTQNVADLRKADSVSTNKFYKMP